MARNSRPSVCRDTLARNSSHSHWHRSTSRQRTIAEGDPPDGVERGPSAPGLDPGERRSTPRSGIKGDQCCTLRVVGPRRLTRRFAVDQAIRTMGVEPHGPVPDDLQRHAADRCGLGHRRACARAARLSVVDRGQRQQTTRLASAFARARRAAQARRAASGRSQIGMAHSFSVASLETDLDRLGKPLWVLLSGRWYNASHAMQAGMRATAPPFGPA